MSASWLDLGLALSSAQAVSTPFSNYSPVIVNGSISGSGVSQTSAPDARSSAAAKSPGGVVPLDTAATGSKTGLIIGVAVLGLLGVGWYIWKG